MRAGIFLMLGGYIILMAARNGIALMVIGIILIDMGLQSTHIPNLSRNYSLLPHARTRLNTIYMTFFFIGGTIGSSLGSVAWNKGGWTGVCFSGIILIILGSLPVFLSRIQKKAIA
jgi:predicted MFS family arabinose efflux permease